MDRRSLRKQNGANNSNAQFTWEKVEEIRRLNQSLSHYGHLKILAHKYKTSRYAIWRIITNQSYLKKPHKKEENINRLVEEWIKS